MCGGASVGAETSGWSPREDAGCYLPQAQCVLAVLGGSPTPHWTHSTRFSWFLCKLFPETLEVWAPLELGLQAPVLEGSGRQGSTTQLAHSPSALPSWVDSVGRFALPGLCVPHHSLQKP